MGNVIEWMTGHAIVAILSLNEVTSAECAKNGSKRVNFNSFAESAKMTFHECVDSVQARFIHLNMIH